MANLEGGPLMDGDPRRFEGGPLFVLGGLRNVCGSGSGESLAET